MVNILLSQYNFNEGWAKDILSEYIKASDSVAVLSFAFNDDWISNNEEWNNAYNKEYGRYYKSVVEPFIDFGIDEDKIVWLNYFEHTEEEMQHIILNSDIIFLTGGLPDKAVERINEKKLNSTLHDCKVVIGASAGALMQLKAYHVSPDADYPKFMLFKGLGLLQDNFYLEVHYENSDLQNKCIEKVLKEKANKVYAVGDRGGMIIDHKKITAFGDVKVFTI